MSVGEERLEFERASDEVEKARWLASSAGLFDPDVTLDGLLELIAAKARATLGTTAATALLFPGNLADVELRGVAGDEWSLPPGLAADVRREGKTVRGPGDGSDAATGSSSLTPLCR